MDPGFRILNDLELAGEHLSRAQVLLMKASALYREQWVNQAKQELEADQSELAPDVSVDSELAIAIPDQRPVSPELGVPAELTHAVAFEGHRASLLDEPPSRPL